MTYGQFIVPTDAELEEVLGVSPEIVEDDPTVNLLRVTSVGGDDVLISYDVPGRSFRIQISSDGRTQLDILRESATQLKINAEGEAFRLLLATESKDLTGELEILVGSSVAVQDRLLMT